MDAELLVSGVGFEVYTRQPNATCRRTVMKECQLNMRTHISVATLENQTYDSSKNHSKRKQDTTLKITQYPIN